MNPLLLGGLALAGIVAALASKSDQVKTKLAKVLPHRKKGGGNRAVVPFTLKAVGKRKVVVEDPRILAQRASELVGRKIPVGTFTLAALMASEAGTGNDLAKVAVGFAAMTMAQRKKMTLHGLLARDGHYGSQLGSNPPASTRQAPTVKDIELAEAIAAGKFANPAPGAEQWDSPQAQDKLAASGAPGYVMDDGTPITAEVVKSRREAQGKQAVTLPGVNPRYLRLWRPVA